MPSYITESDKKKMKYYMGKCFEKLRHHTKVFLLIINTNYICYKTGDNIFKNQGIKRGSNL